MTDSPEGVVGDLQEMTDGGLRTVAEYDQDGYRFEFIRPDVEAAVSKEQLDRIHEGLVLQGLGTAALEDLFGAGSLECSVHRFESVTAFHFVRDEESGLFVSVDSDAEFDFARFVDTCKELF